ncbi:MAG: DUF2142 domain-containing protein [Actinobacteria bacterium]|nr:DUF2142 domain-containing protein [Actinomycetota bacterium]
MIERLNSLSDRALRGVAAAIVVLMFLAVGLVAVKKLGSVHPLLLGSTSVPPAAPVTTLEPGDDVCIVDQYVPEGTATVKFASRDWRDGNSVVRLKSFEAGEREGLESPPVEIPGATGRIDLPLASPVASDGPRSFCVELTGTAIELAGLAEHDRDVSSKLLIDGKAVEREPAIGFYSAPRSVRSELGDVLRRASYFRPGWVGPGAYVALLLLVIVALLAALTLLLRAGAPNLAARHWMLVIALVTLVNGLAWSVVTPPFHAPDEQEHFSYIDTLVNRGLPQDTAPPGAYTPRMQDILATEWRGIVLNQDVKPPWRAEEDRKFRERQKELLAYDDEASSVTSAAGYSPVYYAIAAVPYKLGGDDYILSQWLIRLLSVLMTIGGALFAFATARELRANPWWFAPVTGLIVGSLPMFLHIGAAVHPDALVNMLGCALIYSVTLVLKRGLTRRRALAVGGIFGLMFVVKPVAAGLLPALLVAVWFALRRDGRPARAGLLDLAPAAGLAFALVAVNFVLFGSGSEAVSDATGEGQMSFSLTGLASYAWQWFLPALDFQFHWFDAGLLTTPAIGVIVQGFVANFNHLDTQFEFRYYQALAVALALSAVAMTAKLWRMRESAAQWWPFTAFALTAVIGLTGFLILSAYLLAISTNSWLIQGRYYLPLASLAAIYVAALALSIGRRAGHVAAVVFVCGFGLLNLASLGLSLSRFYV